jgi:glycosyltransferase involved in cell wall biosynthesis
MATRENAIARALASFDDGSYRDRLAGSFSSGNGGPTKAMSAGRPVVAYRVGGMPDLIEDRVSGCLVPRGDIDQLTQVVRDLLHDEDAARRMGRAARQRVEQGFDYRQMASRYLELLSTLRAGR